MTPKRNFIIIVVLFVVVAGGLYYVTSRPAMAPTPQTEEEPSENPASEVRTEHYESATGLSFDYPAEYIAITPEFPDEAAQEVVTLFTEADYEDLINSTEPREGPTAISVQVFGNEGGLTPQEWVEQNAQIANYSTEVTSLTDAAVAGVSGVRYRFTGLYEGESVAVSSGGYLYLFSVTWMSTSDQIRNDFETVLQSVTF